MHIIVKRIMRWLVRAICVFLPENKAHALERWRRQRRLGFLIMLITVSGIVPQFTSILGEGFSLARLMATSGG